MGGRIEDVGLGPVVARETGLMCANMLRAFQVGKALISDGGPSMDAALAYGLGPGELAGVPFDEGAPWQLPFTSSIK